MQILRSIHTTFKIAFGITKGESKKSKERARLEKIQIQQTIEAETDVKVAKFNLIKEK